MWSELYFSSAYCKNLNFIDLKGLLKLNYTESSLKKKDKILSLFIRTSSL